MTADDWNRLADMVATATYKVEIGNSADGCCPTYQILVNGEELEALLRRHAQRLEESK